MEVNERHGVTVLVLFWAAAWVVFAMPVWLILSVLATIWCTVILIENEKLNEIKRIRLDARMRQTK